MPEDETYPMDQPGGEDVSEGDEVEDATPPSEHTEPQDDQTEKRDRISLLIDEAKKAVNERRQYEKAYRELAAALTGKETEEDDDEEEKSSIPEVEALRKEIRALKEIEPLKKELAEMKKRLREPAANPRSQPAVGTKNPSSTGNARSIKEAADFLMKKAREGTPMTKDDWERLGFRRT